MVYLMMGLPQSTHRAFEQNVVLAHSDLEIGITDRITNYSSRSYRAPSGNEKMRVVFKNELSTCKGCILFPPVPRRIGSEFRKGPSRLAVLRRSCCE